MALSRMTEEIGRVLGGRYRLIAPLGMGTSSQVFLADDVKLRRRVAVKLLHAALADDPAFIRRFSSEVRAVAALRHPHILAIHDWSDGDEPYLVTEFLGGGSLRGMLDRGSRLTPSQALQIGLASARALDFAHSRGLVHRGLKPSNLLFGDDGRLRIGDFGLARALAEAASTEPQGAVLGSARYSAPEQVQGHSADGRADVYALSLVLVEAVTGVVPFSADTTIATLMARVDTPLPVPEELGALRDPLRRAGSPTLDERLDAAGFVTALMGVADALPAPDPLPLAGVDDDHIELRGSGATGGAGSANAGTSIPDDITYVGQIPTSSSNSGGSPPPPASDIAEPAGPPAERSEAPGQPAAVVLPAGDDLPDPGTAEPDGLRRDPQPVDHEVVAQSRGRRARRAWIALAALLVVAALAVGAVAFLASRTPTHLIPAFAGRSEAVVTAQLRDLGFKPKVENQRRDGTAAGQVLELRPAPGKRVAEGHTVVVVVSQGPTLVKLPTDVVGHDQASAEAELRRLGLFLQPAQAAWSESVEAGAVVGYAEGTPSEVARGQTVTLVISQGPQPRTVPASSGLTVDDAKAALSQLGLVPQTVEVFSDTVSVGGFVGFAPASGASVARGATVQVQVSKGPEMVKVPSIDGARSIDQAVQLLESAGLQAGEAQGRLSGRPRAFDPPSGTLVRKGSSVDIILR